MEYTAFEFGKLAYKNGMSCIPAKDQKFCECHLKNTQVGEGILPLKEWIAGWNAQCRIENNNFF